MVLFSKNVLTKSYLLAHRAFSTSQPKAFAQLIKSMPRPTPALPHADHVKSVKTWRYFFIFGALPAFALIQINVSFFEDHHPKRPDFKPYEYMRRRIKKFPWGDGNHSLFHNPHYNALPDGYETPDHGDDDHGHH